MGPQTVPLIFVVSDGRGVTCDQLLQSALVQYPDQKWETRIWSNVRSGTQIEELLHAASQAGATVFYTLVSPETRSLMQRRAADLLVPVVDVLGPAMSALHDVFRAEPNATPGLFYVAERERFDRQVAIDYTLAHDDGQRPWELKKADVVIVGVSRASKSSTCFYLAYHGVKAANVPLLADTPPLPDLLKVDPRKVVGLRMNISRLMTVRDARAKYLGRQFTDSYRDKREIAREVMFANNLMSQNGWQSVEASYMAIEEIAKDVMRLIGRGKILD